MNHIISIIGTTIFYFDKDNLNWHREDGPAIEWVDGTKQWRQFGNTHREDGPAIEYSDGRKEWFGNGSLLEVLTIK